MPEPIIDRYKAAFEAWMDSDDKFGLQSEDFDFVQWLQHNKYPPRIVRLATYARRTVEEVTK